MEDPDGETVPSGQLGVTMSESDIGLLVGVVLGCILTNLTWILGWRRK
jgi:tetrahydromethanopterin S-methyltransferase subunit G